MVQMLVRQGQMVPVDHPLIYFLMPLLSVHSQAAEEPEETYSSFSEWYYCYSCNPRAGAPVVAVDLQALLLAVVMPQVMLEVRVDSLVELITINFRGPDLLEAMEMDRMVRPTPPLL